VLAALSAGIEFLQYHFCLGRCEIDDVIHNTAGALLGCLAAVVLPRLLASTKK
jgi:glycopeptide antibiotics resistance protein